MKGFAILAVGLFCLLSLAQGDYPWPLQASSETCGFAANNDDLRLDCFPEAGATEEKCVERGCCWKQTVDGRPWCYYPEVFSAFEVLNETHIGRKYRSQFPKDINLLRLDVAVGEHVAFRVSFFSCKVDIGFSRIEETGVFSYYFRNCTIADSK